MTQIERIMKMEEILDEAEKAVRNLSEALEKYDETREKLKELRKYYEGGDWQKDFEDDEAGKLPNTLKRGVLSEDAVYNLLEENKELTEEIKELAEKL